MTDFPSKGEAYSDVKLPSDLVKIIDDRIVGTFGYRSRSEVVKEAVRAFVRDILKENPAGK